MALLTPSGSIIRHQKSWAEKSWPNSDRSQSAAVTVWVFRQPQVLAFRIQYPAAGDSSINIVWSGYGNLYLYDKLYCLTHDKPTHQGSTLCMFHLCPLMPECDLTVLQNPWPAWRRGWIFRLLLCPWDKACLEAVYKNVPICAIQTCALICMCKKNYVFIVSQYWVIGISPGFCPGVFDICISAVFVNLKRSCALWLKLKVALHI